LPIDIEYSANETQMKNKKKICKKRFHQMYICGRKMEDGIENENDRSDNCRAISPKNSPNITQSIKECMGIPQA